jgi:hypothetical protein
MFYRLKGCGRCGGDLLQDNDEWRCLQCGHVYYPECAQLELEWAVVAQAGFTSSQKDDQKDDREDDREDDRQRPKIRRSARHLTPDTSVTRFNEEQWWDRNQPIIGHLDQGMKVREIAEIVGKGPRQIRVVRERLRDLRSANLELAGVS